MTKRAVILAGGKGARLAPYTLVFPKPLMPLGETPILEIVVRQLVSCGFDRITMAVGYLAELIESYFGDGARFGVQIDYVREDTPLGTAGPLSLIGEIDEPLLIMNGDVLTTLDYGAFLAGHAASGAAMTVSTFVRTHVVDFGVIETDGDRVTGYLEKPTSQYAVSMGINAVSPAAMRRLVPGERKDIPDLVLELVAAGETVRASRFDGYWLDIGRHDDFAAAQEEFQLHRAEFLREEA
jgi:NDP-sugar pyrophosphorylase family protein